MPSADSLAAMAASKARQSAAANASSTQKALTAIRADDKKVGSQSTALKAIKADDKKLAANLANATANAAAMQKAQAAIRADDKNAASQASALRAIKADDKKFEPYLPNYANALQAIKADDRKAASKTTPPPTTKTDLSGDSKDISGETGGSTPDGGSDSSGSDNNQSSNNSGNASSAVKIASSNLFVFDESSVSVESMTDLIFEDIGGRELIDITSNDLVYDLTSQTADNQPIKNLSLILERYNPKSLISLQGSSDTFFNSFQLEINNYIPLVSTKATTGNPNASHVYVETDDLNNLDHLVIETVNIDLENNERVEVQILSYDSLHNGTIY